MILHGVGMGLKIDLRVAKPIDRRMKSRAIVREFLQRLKAASHAEDREVNIRSSAGLHQFVSRETGLSGRLDGQRIEQQRD